MCFKLGETLLYITGFKGGCTSLTVKNIFYRAEILVKIMIKCETFSKTGLLGVYGEVEMVQGWKYSGGDVALSQTM